MSYCIVNRSRPKFITYQYQDKLVFVAPAASYEDALDVAQKEFPKLAKVPRERITFHVLVLNSESNSQQSIRISPDAWSGTIDKAAPGQVVKIDVLQPSKKFWSFKRAHSEERTETPKQDATASLTVSSSSSRKSWIEGEVSHSKSDQ